MLEGMQSIVPTMLRHNYSAVSRVSKHECIDSTILGIQTQRNIMQCELGVLQSEWRDCVVN